MDPHPGSSSFFSFKEGIVCLFNMFWILSCSETQVLAQLMDYSIEEGQSMCLVAAPWWSYWSNYAALTKEDVLRVPERLALGLHKTEVYLDQASLSAEEPVVEMGVKGTGTEGVKGGATASSAESMVDKDSDKDGDADKSAARDAGAGSGNGNGHAHSGGQATGSLGGGGKDKAVPTTLARRPHEIDNSRLQVRNERGQTTAPLPLLCAFVCFLCVFVSKDKME